MKTRHAKKVIVAFVVGLFIAPASLYAQIDLNEIQTQLNASVSLFQSLKHESSAELKSDLIDTEAKKLYLILGYLLSDAQNLILSGKVLGAKYPTETSQPIVNTITYNPLDVAEISLKPVNSNLTQLNAGGQARTILTFRVDAMYADAEIVSTEIIFDEQMWKYAEEIYLVSSGKIKAKYSPVDEEDFYELDNDLYRLRFNNLGIKVPKNHYRKIYIKVKLKDSVPDGKLVTVFLNNRSVRVSDKTGFNDFLPYNSGGIDGDFIDRFIMKDN